MDDLNWIPIVLKKESETDCRRPKEGTKPVAKLERVERLLSIYHMLWVESKLHSTEVK